MPGCGSICSLSRETGVSQTSLSRWREQATTLGSLTKRKPPAVTPSGSSPQRRPDDRSAEEKLRLVLDASALGEASLGEFLRRNGVHETDLAAWRQAALSGLSNPTVMQARPGDARRVRELERELRRKNDALAETAALLVLKKKVLSIWGDADDDTKPGSEE
jgi:transposase